MSEYSMHPTVLPVIISAYMFLLVSLYTKPVPIKGTVASLGKGGLFYEKFSHFMKQRLTYCIPVSSHLSLSYLGSVANNRILRSLRPGSWHAICVQETFGSCWIQNLFQGLILATWNLAVNKVALPLRTISTL